MVVKWRRKTGREGRWRESNEGRSGKGGRQRAPRRQRNVECETGKGSDEAAVEEGGKKGRRSDETKDRQRRTLRRSSN